MEKEIVMTYAGLRAIEEELEMLYYEDEDFSEDETDPERLFRKWLRDNNYSVRREKRKKHPYSGKTELVEAVYDVYGNEHEMTSLRKYYQHLKERENAPEIFGIKKPNYQRKKKNAADTEDNNSKK